MLTETQCKRLTEFLGEKFHHVTQKGTISSCSCGEKFGSYSMKNINHISRTFTTEADMMALYRRLWETGKWLYPVYGFEYWAYHKFYMPDALSGYMNKFTFDSWLFCLSGEDYEVRCGMVDNFLIGGNEK